MVGTHDMAPTWHQGINSRQDNVGESMYIMCDRTYIQSQLRLYRKNNAHTDDGSAANLMCNPHIKHVYNVWY